MRRILCFLVILTMTLTMMGVSGWSQTQEITTEEFKPKLPDYHKLDPDLTRELNAKGEKVKGKELPHINGKAYIKPEELDNLEPLDVRGKAKGIAILVDFPEPNGVSEVPGVDYERVPAEMFDDLLNGTEYNPYELDIFQDLKEHDGEIAPTDRTMRNYYNEVSYGQFEIDVDVVGWYTLDKPYDYYLGQDKGYYNANGDAHIAELVIDAINKANDNGVDFSQYAVPAKPGDFWLYGDSTSFEDENGNVITEIVPNIFIIHRGTGAEYSTDPSIIWSHKWDIVSATYYGEYFKNGNFPDESELKFMTVDGVALNTYNIVPEVGQDITGYLKVAYPEYVPDDYEGREPSPAYPGVYAHEFGHVLGLPDQYDYGYDSEGTGMFTLMASGSYGRNIADRYYSGNTPVHMDAWSKCYLGFVDPIEIRPEDGRSTITLKPSATDPDIYKIVVPGSNGREYFLLENRQQIGYDTGLSYNEDGENLHGLVVYHVVEDIFMRNFHRPNEAQNWDINHRGKAQMPTAWTGEHHYAISIIQADGKYDLEHGENDGDAGDVFPGKGNVTRLTSKLNISPNTTSLYQWIPGNSETGITIDNIVENEDGSITCDVYFAK